MTNLMTVTEQQMASLIASARAEGRAEIVERVETAFIAAAEVSPREFDSKRVHPDLAYRRCKQPNCSLWAWGQPTPDDLHFCAYHEAIEETRQNVLVALTDPGDEQGAS